jgi:TRAP-type C4-dicarboxylate transport system substrate-binding protein
MRIVMSTVAMMTVLATAACGGADTTEAEPQATDSGASAAVGDPITLRFNYFTSKSNPHGSTWAKWMEEVTARSGGSITFDEYWDGTLLSADATIEGLKDGRADVAIVVSSFYAGRFPLTSVNELPFASNNAVAVTAAMRELSQENEDLQKEWSDQGLKPLAWTAAAPSSLVSTKPLRTAEDFEGLKIRAIDRSGKVLQAAGANIVAMGPNELYGSLERGVLDATSGISFGVVHPLKLEEVGDYIVDPSLGTSTASALTINPEKWDELSDEQKRILEEVSAEVPDYYAAFNLQTEEATCQAVKVAGNELSVLPEEEVGKLRAAGEQLVVDEWLNELAEAGHDGTAFRKAFDDAVAAAEAQYPEGELSGVARCLGG